MAKVEHQDPEELQREDLKDERVEADSIWKSPPSMKLNAQNCELITQISIATRVVELRGKLWSREVEGEVEERVLTTRQGEEEKERDSRSKQTDPILRPDWENLQIHPLPGQKKKEKEENFLSSKFKKRNPQNPNQIPYSISMPGETKLPRKAAKNPTSSSTSAFLTPLAPTGTTVVAQFRESADGVLGAEGETLGPTLNLPADVSPDHLKLLLNNLLQNVS